MVEYTVTLEGYQYVEHRLNQYEHNIKHRRRMMNDVGLYMRGSIDKNFRAQGRPQRWVRLSPVTLALREHGGNRILEDTGQLRASITHTYDDEQVEIGTNRKKARLLQFGDPHHMWGSHIVNIPPRPFVMIQDEDKKNIMKIVKDQVKKR